MTDKYKTEPEEGEGMNKKQWLAGSALSSWLAVAEADGASKLNLTPGVTAISNEVYDLHMMVLWICTGIGIVVFGAMFYSILKHRKAAGHEPAQFHESTKVEIVWTLIPFIIIVVMAVTATRTLIAMERTPDPDLTIKVTGYQWKWEYEYLGGQENSLPVYRQ